MKAGADLVRRLAEALASRHDVEPGVPPASAPSEPPPALFVASPVPLAPASVVRGPGDWFTHSVTGAPLLVVRGYDGALRGFLNVCRHQGNRVVGGDQGRGASGFQCPNHDWRYDTNGRLVGAPDPDDVDPDEAIGLYPVPVAERHGMVFALPSTARVSDPASWLGALDADSAALELDTCRVERLRERTRGVSWADVATLFVDVPRLLGWEAPGRVVRDVAGSHQRFAAAPADTAPGEVAERAVLGWYLFPSVLVLAHAGQVSLLGAFRQESGLVGWRHEVLVRQDAVVDPAWGVVLEQRLFALEGRGAPPTDSPGVRAFRHHLAHAVAALR